MPVQNTFNTKQHYVPRMLLRGFAITCETESVWTFDKRTGSSFRINIEKIATERGYYDLNGLADIDAAMNEADNAAAAVINKIRARPSLSGISQHDRTTIAIFVALQLLRTRAYQEGRSHLVKSFTESILQREEGLPPDWCESHSEDKLREQYLRSISQSALKFTPYILNKDLLLMKAVPDLKFMISDHPVAMHNTTNPGNAFRGTLGLAVKGIEIYLPISSELTLAYICPSVGLAYEAEAIWLRSLGGFVRETAICYLQSRDTGKALVLSTNHVRHQNSLQIINAERFVISSVNDFSDASEITREDPEARFGRRVIVH